MGTCIDSGQPLVTVMRSFSVPHILVLCEMPIMSISFSADSFFLSDVPVMCCRTSGH